MADIDVVVPVHNEEGNIRVLTDRLVKALSSHGLDYNIIFVDDYSTDNTVSEVVKAAQKYSKDKFFYDFQTKNDLYTRNKRGEVDIVIDSPNIKLVKKVGPKGKAYSILQGARAGVSPFIAMIDGDLQYPPEAIPEMLSLAKTCGMVVARRSTNNTSLLRKAGTKLNILLFEKLLLGLSCDSQSGLKVFNREIIKEVNLSEVTPWTLDLPLLLTAQDLGFEIKSFDIEFSERLKGTSKVNFIKTGLEIAKSAIKLKFRNKKVFQIEPLSKKSGIIGAGIAYKGKRFITHSRLPVDITAIHTFVPWQEFFAAFVVCALIFGLVINPALTGIAIISFLSVAYFLDLSFSMYVISRSLNNSPEIKVRRNEIKKLNSQDLPVYTILCPLYREANVLPDFVKSLEKLKWPKNKLDAILLLEEDDKETIKTAQNLELPSWLRILIVPDSYPKTKPKACNYGLAQAKGEFLVVYDAEDRPDPLQLKRAYIAFNKINSKVVCLQCKLNYYNPTQNIITRLFTAEYSLWFDLILPGLQSLETTIPLGGTSNHFRTSALRYLDGWDPFNVTEDCDLGTRLFKSNFRTAIVDSTTYEEANSRYKGWIKQRSRWIKGYLQTYLVHMRHPMAFYKKYGKHALIFQLVTGIRMVFTLINPILWITTLSYFAFRPIVGPAIEALYPRAIFYIASFSAVFGNFFYLYLYMIAAAKKGQWGLIKYVFLIPFYWFSASFAAVLAFYQLLTKPHYWEKTAHGLNTPESQVPPSESSEEAQEEFIPSPEPVPAPAYYSMLENSKNRISKLFNGYLFKNQLITQGGILIAAVSIANVLNFLFNAYLGRVIDLAEFGLLSLINNIYSLTALFTGAVATTISYKAAHNLGRYNGIVKDFWKQTRSKIWFFSIAVTALWLLASSNLQHYFNSDSIWPFLLFAPFFGISFVASVDSGFLSGSLKFAAIALLTALSPLFKLILAFVFVKINFINGIYLSIPLSTVLPFILGWLIISRMNNSHTERLDKKAITFPMDFFGVSILSKFSTVIFLSADVILAKHFLSPVEAGQYALLSLAGKIIYFLGSLFAQFVNPLTSRAEGAKTDSKSSFNKLFILTTLSSLFGFLLIGVFGKFTVPLLFGSKAISIVSLLPVYSIGIVCFTLASSLTTYHQAKGNYLFPILGFLLAGVEIVSISLFHQNVGKISEIVSLTGFIYLITVNILHYIYPALQVIGTRVKDATKLLGKRIPEPAYNRNGNLRILIFNWRDTKHIWAGGAEVYVHEIAKRWVKDGHSVTLFCGNDRKNPDQEVIDGVQIIRRGGFYTVYLWAPIYYLAKFKGKFDLIIDSENGVPFFTPLFARIPVIGLIHHVHADIFLKGLKLPYYLLPIAFIAKQMETVVMPLVYKNVQMATVSSSSKKDMLKLGFGKVKPIQIIHPGVDISILKPGVKTDYPSILYLGRLQPYKSIDTIINAMTYVVKAHPNAKLKIAGFGESREFLEKLTKTLHFESCVEFLGRVSDELKNELLSSSWVFAQPSVMEGFGISVIEAGASGTPVVASDVPGLRDSVKNPSSGFLVQHGNPKAFAEKINLIISDSNLRRSLEKESLIWAKNFTWDKSSEKLLRVARFEIARRSTIPNLIDLAVSES